MSGTVIFHSSGCKMTSLHTQLLKKCSKMEKRSEGAAGAILFETDTASGVIQNFSKRGTVSKSI